MNVTLERTILRGYRCGGGACLPTRAGKRSKGGHTRLEATVIRSGFWDALRKYSTKRDRRNARNIRPCKIHRSLSWIGDLAKSCQRYRTLRDAEQAQRSHRITS